LVARFLGHQTLRVTFSLLARSMLAGWSMTQQTLFEDSAAPLIPRQPTLARLRDAARACRACPLWNRATQTVFGEGSSDARVVLVGEQPGDREDIEGRPFVGPAGKLLDACLEEAGIDRAKAYVTNVVKHFKWEPRGKKRIHQKPNSTEIAACRPWLDAEIAVIQPKVVVCLGATAAQALLGASFRVTKSRGVFVPSDLAPYVMATVHPSSILRAPDPAARDLETKAFISDLKKIARVLVKSE
jgi:DNA polymerase